MKTSLISSMVILSAVSLTASAEEFSWSNVTFQPRAYAGYADFTIETSEYIDRTDVYPVEKETSPERWTLASLDKNKLHTTGLLAGIGGTVAVGNFFGDIYYQSTPTNEVASSSGEAQQGPSTLSWGETKLQHKDWALSLGYRITDQWTVFTGYKSGETEWDQPSFLSMDVANRETKYTGKLNQEGPFLGTAYSFLIGPGALTIKAAYAYLDGTDKEHTSNSVKLNTGGGYVDNGYYKMDGNSNAYSLGVSWTQDLAENLGFSIGANYHNYQFDMSGSKTVYRGDTLRSEAKYDNGTMTEELFSLTASITYRF